MYGANPLAAHFAGVDVTRLLIRVYAVSGLFAAIAGLVVMSRANSAKADYGSSYLLLAVLIAVLGGVNPYGGYGRVIGVVLAVLSMQFLSSGLNMLGVSNFARELIWGALLLLVMVVNAGSWPRRRAPPRAQDPRGRSRMKKILNNRPADYVDEMLDGLVAAHPRVLPPARRQPPGRSRARAPGAPARSAIVTGGGSGHLPVFTGYVGTGPPRRLRHRRRLRLADRRADGRRDPRRDQGGRGVLTALRQLRRRRDELRHGGRPRRVRGHRDDDRPPRRRRRLGPPEEREKRRGVAGHGLRLQDRRRRRRGGRATSTR